MSEPTTKIETMLTCKEVQAVLQWSHRKMMRRLAEKQWQRTLGAKWDGGEWRFIRWRVERYAMLSDD